MGKQGTHPNSLKNLDPHNGKAGRRPDRLAKYINEKKISKNDIQACIHYVMGLTKQELEEARKDKNTPMLLHGLISAAIKDASNGNMSNLLKMIEIEHGRSEQPISFKGGLTLKNYDVPVSEEEAKDFVEKVSTVLPNDLQSEAEEITPDND